MRGSSASRCILQRCIEPAQFGRSYRRGVKKGLLKILSKMGIGSIASYRGAGLFEIVGLDANRHFGFLRALFSRNSNRK